MKSIFDTIELDRSKVKWEDYLDKLTPVERVGDLYFKRDDAFAPLGMGFINGTKVRQGIYLFAEYVLGKKQAIVGGMSIHSPQHSMQSVVAKHFGVDSIHVVGATTPVTALKHEDIAIGNMFGGKFHLTKVAYNMALQKSVKEYEASHPGSYALGYAISLDHKTHTPSEIEKFHAVSSLQVQNIPDHIENLIVPSGSCNSVTSILYGIAKYKPKSLKNVYMIGIGPPKIKYVEERLDVITAATGLDTKPFQRFYPQHKDIEQQYSDAFGQFTGDSDHRNDYRYNLIFDDIHTQGIVKYGELQPESYETISFHDNYEGKVWRHIKNKYGKTLINDRTCFWIVGNKPSLNGLKKESVWDRIQPMLRQNVSELVTV